MEQFSEPFTNSTSTKRTSSDVTAVPLLQAMLDQLRGELASVRMALDSERSAVKALKRDRAKEVKAVREEEAIKRRNALCDLRSRLERDHDDTLQRQKEVMTKLFNAEMLRTLKTKDSEKRHELSEAHGREEALKLQVRDALQASRLDSQQQQSGATIGEIQKLKQEISTLRAHNTELEDRLQVVSDADRQKAIDLRSQHEEHEMKLSLIKKSSQQEANKLLTELKSKERQISHLEKQLSTQTGRVEEQRERLLELQREPHPRDWTCSDVNCTKAHEKRIAELQLAMKKAAEIHSQEMKDMIGKLRELEGNSPAKGGSSKGEMFQERKRKSNIHRKEQAKQYYTNFMELEPVAEMEEDSGAGEDSISSSGSPSLSPQPYGSGDIWVDLSHKEYHDTLYSCLLKEHFDLQREHQFLQIRLKRELAEPNRIQICLEYELASARNQIREFKRMLVEQQGRSFIMAERIVTLQSEIHDLQEQNELLEFRILELEECHQNSLVGSHIPDSRDVGTDTENDINDSGEQSPPTGEVILSDNLGIIQGRESKILPECTNSSSNDISKINSRIIATVLPFTDITSDTKRDKNDINEGETPKKQLKNAERLQESGIFEETEFYTQGTQTEGEEAVFDSNPRFENGIVGDLRVEIQKLNLFRERIEEKGTNTCCTHKTLMHVDGGRGDGPSSRCVAHVKELQYCRERLQILEDKVLIYESSGEIQTRLLSERLQREVRLIAQVNDLSSKVEQLSSQNKLLEEERCEFEEAENDARLKCQKLEARLLDINEQKSDLQTQLQLERRNMSRLKNSLSESERKRQEARGQVSYVETILNKYENRNYELEEREVELRHRLEMLETTMPALMLFNMWRLVQDPKVSRAAVNTAVSNTLVKARSGKSQGKMSPYTHDGSLYRPMTSPELNTSVYSAKQITSNLPHSSGDELTKLRYLEEDRNRILNERQQAEEKWRLTEKKLTERLEALESQGDPICAELENYKEAEEGYKERIRKLENELYGKKGQTGETSVYRTTSEVTSDTDIISSATSLGCESIECMKKIQELVQSEATMKNRITELELKERAYMETLQQADELWSEMEHSYKTRITRAEDSEAVLKDKVRKLEESESKFRQTYTQEDENYVLMEKIQSMEQNEKEFVEKIHALETEKNKLVQETTQLREALIAAQTELQKTKELVEGPLKEELVKERKLSKTLQEEIKTAETELQEVTSAHDAEVSSLKSLLTKTSRELVDLECTNSELKEEVETLETKIIELKSSLDDQKAKEEALLIQTSQTILEKEKELEEAKREIEYAKTPSAHEELKEVLPEIQKEEISTKKLQDKTEDVKPCLPECVCPAAQGTLVPTGKDAVNRVTDNELPVVPIAAEIDIPIEKPPVLTVPEKYVEINTPFKDVLIKEQTETFRNIPAPSEQDRQLEEENVIPKVSFHKPDPSITGQVKQQQPVSDCLSGKKRISCLKSNVEQLEVIGTVKKQPPIESPFDAVTAKITCPTKTCIKDFHEVSSSEGDSKVKENVITKLPAIGETITEEDDKKDNVIMKVSELNKITPHSSNEELEVPLVPSTIAKAETEPSKVSELLPYPDATLKESVVAKVPPLSQLCPRTCICPPEGAEKTSSDESFKYTEHTETAISAPIALAEPELESTEIGPETIEQLPITEEQAPVEPPLESIEVESETIEQLPITELQAPVEPPLGSIEVEPETIAQLPVTEEQVLGEPPLESIEVQPETIEQLPITEEQAPVEPPLGSIEVEPETIAQLPVTEEQVFGEPPLESIEVKPETIAQLPITQEQILDRKDADIWPTFISDTCGIELEEDILASPMTDGTRHPFFEILESSLGDSIQEVAEAPELIQGEENLLSSGMAVEEVSVSPVEEVIEEKVPSITTDLEIEIREIPVEKIIVAAGETKLSSENVDGTIPVTEIPTGESAEYPTQEPSEGAAVPVEELDAGLAIPTEEAVESPAEEPIGGQVIPMEESAGLTIPTEETVESSEQMPKEAEAIPIAPVAMTETQESQQISPVTKHDTLTSEGEKLVESEEVKLQDSLKETKLKCTCPFYRSHGGGIPQIEVEHTEQPIEKSVIPPTEEESIEPSKEVVTHEPQEKEEFFESLTGEEPSDQATEAVLTETPLSEIPTETPIEEVPADLPSDELTDIPTEEVPSDMPTEEVLTDTTEEVASERPPEEVPVDQPMEVFDESPKEEVPMTPLTDVPSEPPRKEQYADEQDKVCPFDPNYKCKCPFMTGEKQIDEAEALEQEQPEPNIEDVQPEVLVEMTLDIPPAEETADAAVPLEIPTETLEEEIPSDAPAQEMPTESPTQDLSPEPLADIETSAHEILTEVLETGPPVHDISTEPPSEEIPIDAPVIEVPPVESHASELEKKCPIHGYTCSCLQEVDAGLAIPIEEAVESPIEEPIEGQAIPIQESAGDLTIPTEETVESLEQMPKEADAIPIAPVALTETQESHQISPVTKQESEGETLNKTPEQKVTELGQMPIQIEADTKTEQVGLTSVTQTAPSEEDKLPDLLKETKLKKLKCTCPFYRSHGSGVPQREVVHTGQPTEESTGKDAVNRVTDNELPVVPIAAEIDIPIEKPPVLTVPEKYVEINTPFKDVLIKEQTETFRNVPAPSEQHRQLEEENVIPKVSFHKPDPSITGQVKQQQPVSDCLSGKKRISCLKSNVEQLEVIGTVKKQPPIESPFDAVTTKITCPIKTCIKDFHEVSSSEGDSKVKENVITKLPAIGETIAEEDDKKDNVTMKVSELNKITPHSSNEELEVPLVPSTIAKAETEPSKVSELLPYPDATLKESVVAKVPPLSQLCPRTCICPPEGPEKTSSDESFKYSESEYSRLTADDFPFGETGECILEPPKEQISFTESELERAFDEPIFEDFILTSKECLFQDEFPEGMIYTGHAGGVTALEPGAIITGEHTETAISAPIALAEPELESAEIGPETIEQLPITEEQAPVEPPLESIEVESETIEQLPITELQAPVEPPLGSIEVEPETIAQLPVTEEQVLGEPPLESIEVQPETNEQLPITELQAPVEPPLGSIEVEPETIAQLPVAEEQVLGEPPLESIEVEPETIAQLPVTEEQVFGEPPLESIEVKPETIAQLPITQEQILDRKQDADIWPTFISDTCGIELEEDILASPMTDGTRHPFFEILESSLGDSIQEVAEAPELIQGEENLLSSGMAVEEVSVSPVEEVIEEKVPSITIDLEIKMREIPVEKFIPAAGETELSSEVLETGPPVHEISAEPPSEEIPIDAPVIEVPPVESHASELEEVCPILGYPCSCEEHKCEETEEISDEMKPLPIPIPIDETIPVTEIPTEESVESPTQEPLEGAAVPVEELDAGLAIPTEESVESPVEEPIDGQAIPIKESAGDLTIPTEENVEFPTEEPSEGAAIPVEELDAGLAIPTEEAVESPVEEPIDGQIIPIEESAGLTIPTEETIASSEQMPKEAEAIPIVPVAMTETQESQQISPVTKQDTPTSEGEKLVESEEVKLPDSLKETELKKSKCTCPFWHISGVPQREVVPTEQPIEESVIPPTEEESIEPSKEMVTHEPQEKEEFFESPTGEEPSDQATEAMPTETPLEEVPADLPTDELTDIPTEEVPSDMPTEEVLTDTSTVEVASERPTEEVPVDQPIEVFDESPKEEVPMTPLTDVPSEPPRKEQYADEQDKVCPFDPNYKCKCPFMTGEKQIDEAEALEQEQPESNIEDVQPEVLVDMTLDIPPAEETAAAAVPLEIPTETLEEEIPSDAPAQEMPTESPTQELSPEPLADIETSAHEILTEVLETGPPVHEISTEPPSEEIPIDAPVIEVPPVESHASELEEECPIHGYPCSCEEHKCEETEEISDEMKPLPIPTEKVPTDLPTEGTEVLKSVTELVIQEPIEVHKGIDSKEAVESVITDVVVSAVPSLEDIAIGKELQGIVDKTEDTGIEIPIQETIPIVVEKEGTVLQQEPLQEEDTIESEVIPPVVSEVIRSALPSEEKIQPLEEITIEPEIIAKEVEEQREQMEAIPTEIEKEEKPIDTAAEEMPIEAPAEELLAEPPEEPSKDVPVEILVEEVSAEPPELPVPSEAETLIEKPSTDVPGGELAEDVSAEPPEIVHVEALSETPIAEPSIDVPVEEFIEAVPAEPPELPSEAEELVKEMPTEIEEPSVDVPVEEFIEAVPPEPPELPSEAEELVKEMPTEIEEPSVDVPVEEFIETVPAEPPELPSEAEELVKEMPTEIEMEEKPIDTPAEEVTIAPTEELPSEPQKLVLTEALPETTIEVPLIDVPVELIEAVPAEPRELPSEAERLVQEMPTEIEMEEKPIDTTAEEVPIEKPTEVLLAAEPVEVTAAELAAVESKICPLEPYTTCICPSVEEESEQKITPSEEPEKTVIAEPVILKEPEEVKESVPSQEIVEPVIGEVVESAISIFEESPIEASVEKKAEEPAAMEVEEIPDIQVELPSEPTVEELPTEVTEEEAPKLPAEVIIQELPSEIGAEELPTEITEEKALELPGVIAQELTSETVAEELPTEIAEEKAIELPRVIAQELPSETVAKELPPEITEEKAPELPVEVIAQGLPGKSVAEELPTEVTEEEVPTLPAKVIKQELPTEFVAEELPTEITEEKAVELPRAQKLPGEAAAEEIPTEIPEEKAPKLPSAEPLSDKAVAKATPSEEPAKEIPMPDKIPPEAVLIEAPIEVETVVDKPAEKIAVAATEQELPIGIDVDVTSMESPEAVPTVAEIKEVAAPLEIAPLVPAEIPSTEPPMKQIPDIPIEVSDEVPTEKLDEKPAMEIKDEKVPSPVPLKKREEAAESAEQVVDELISSSIAHVHGAELVAEDFPPPPMKQIPDIPIEVLDEVPTEKLDEKPAMEIKDEKVPSPVPLKKREEAAESAEQVVDELISSSIAHVHGAELDAEDFPPPPMKQIPDIPIEVSDEVPTEKLDEKPAMEIKDEKVPSPVPLKKREEAAESAEQVVDELISSSIAHVHGAELDAGVVCECCLQPHEGSPLICPLLAKKVGVVTESEASPEEVAAPGGVETVVMPALVGLGEEKTDLLQQLEDLLREKTELQDYINNLENLVKMKSAEMLETKNIMMQLQKKLEGEDVDLIYPPGKKVEETVSVHNTVSELQTILATLQNKCRVKDQMITALANDLRLRAQSGIFDDLIKNASTEDPVCDFDKDQLFDYLKTTEIPPKQPTLSHQEIIVTVKPKFKAKKPAGGETDRTVAIPTSSKQSLRSIRSSTSLRDVNTMGLQVLRRVGPDSLLLGWNVPPGGSFTGFEIYVNGALTHKVRSPSRNKALLQSLDLKSKVVVTMFGLTPQGRSSEPAYLTIQNPTS